MMTNGKCCEKVSATGQVPSESWSTAVQIFEVQGLILFSYLFIFIYLFIYCLFNDLTSSQNIAEL